MTLESPRPVGASAAESATESSTTDGPVYQASDRSEVTAPTVVHSVDPKLSPDVRKHKERGLVGVLLVVGTDGVPRDVTVRCSASPDLTESAVDAVKAWRFKPGMKDGHPVMVQIEVDLNVPN